MPADAAAALPRRAAVVTQALPAAAWVMSTVERGPGEGVGRASATARTVPANTGGVVRQQVAVRAVELAHAERRR